MGLHGWSRDSKRASTRRHPPVQEAGVPSPQDAAEVTLLLQRWAQAVGSGDSHQLAALYCKDGTMLSAGLQAGHAPQVACPSQSLHALTSLGATPTIGSSSVQFMSPTVAICTGTYSLLLPPEPSPPHGLHPYHLQPQQAAPWLAQQHGSPGSSSSSSSAGGGGMVGAGFPYASPSAPLAAAQVQPQLRGLGRVSNSSASSSMSSASTSTRSSVTSMTSASSTGGQPSLRGLHHRGSWDEADAGGLPGSTPGSADAWLGLGQASMGWEQQAAQAVDTGTWLEGALAAGWGQQEEPELVEVGFLFVYCKVGDRWLIAEHHNRELESVEGGAAAETHGLGAGAMPWMLAAGSASATLLQ